jgi:hypothetical protein
MVECAWSSAFLASSASFRRTASASSAARESSAARSRVLVRPRIATADAAAVPALWKPAAAVVVDAAVGAALTATRVLALAVLTPVALVGLTGCASACRRIPPRDSDVRSRFIYGWAAGSLTQQCV